jgi:hypothetical protein
MPKTYDRTEFQIEWDLREFGERPALQPRALHGPRDPGRLAFARALATGDVPANAPQIEQDEAA